MIYDTPETPLAATAGATLRELMDRMGHDSERAAMIYLHGSDVRQQAIADTLSKLARDELKRGSAGKPRQAARKRSARSGHGGAGKLRKSGFTLRPCGR
jgi:hypothetical protein